MIFDELGISHADLEARGLSECQEAECLEIAERGVDGREHLLAPAAAEAWRAMRASALENGIPLFIVSAFRSIDRQAEIVRRKLNAGSSIEEVFTVCAPPGFSEHHTGRAVDVSTEGSPLLQVEFDQTPAFAWLVANASRFGFHLSYPRGNSQEYQYEPWHWCFQSPAQLKHTGHSQRQPVLETPRLRLRPFCLSDAQDVHRLAGDARIADTTVTIPHPYALDAAEQWIESLQGKSMAGSRATFAITTTNSNQLVGTVGLINISVQNRRAELAYWVGVEFWGKGYCTEAVFRVIDFAREHYGSSRIVAHCFARNRASARVMEKTGMQFEGLLRSHLFKNGTYEDLLVYGLVFPERR